MLQQDKYTQLDDLAAPNQYVAAPTAEDLDYIMVFQQVCRRYNIDFSTANQDERAFVMLMAEKHILPQQA